MNVPLPIGCDEDEARRFLGCSENAWKQLRARGIIKALRKGWFAYADLIAAVEALRTERDKILYLDEEKTQSRTKSRRKVGSEGSQSSYRTPEELLR